MTPSADRRYLLARCLRLEARVWDLEEKLRLAKPGRRNLQPEDRAHIQALHATGMNGRAIARSTGWSAQTVYNVLK